jgi:nitrite reductase (NADH) large subunit
MKQEQLIVVGAGMVAQRFCDRLLELDQARRFRVVVFGEEKYAPYDRVNLASYYDLRDPKQMRLGSSQLYAADSPIAWHLGQQVSTVDAQAHTIAAGDATHSYRHLVLATGCRPTLPPLPGVNKPGVFVYRDIADLMKIEAYARGRRQVLVLGGGLLGLECAHSLLSLGLKVVVVESATRLLPKQMDDAGARLLREKVEALGIKTLIGKSARAIEGDVACTGMRFSDDSVIAADMIIVAAGVTPRDELARQAGLMIGARGGVVVDDGMATSDPSIYAIGEVAQHRGVCYGLVAPCYEMADVLARRLVGQEASFVGAQQSTKLKRFSFDVAVVGDPFSTREQTKEVVLHDMLNGVYKRLVVSADKKQLLGACMVGDASEYATLAAYCRSRQQLPEHAEELITGGKGDASTARDAASYVCACNNVSRAQVCAKIREGVVSVGALKSATRAGTGCGGCTPIIQDILNQELAASGEPVLLHICEHLQFTRQELYEIVAVRGYRSFREIIEKIGRGSGCEICKPAVASVLASVHNEPILNHETLQDTNDRFLANLQRGGLYSVVPRIPGGEITPEKLIKLGEVARKYGLYTKITGGQRIDLLGAQLNQLPEIWQELIEAGFESGHAYGKAVRTVKSCVGSTWCRYGVQDSMAFAIAVEQRYKGIRAPHKLKSAVSGCMRECAEVQSKDFGVIATERGWNLYVCGNGGAKPRHADLLAVDLDSDACLRMIDRFLMFYIRTADKLTRTSTWIEKMDGGIGHLKDVIVKDSLGLCTELERDMRKMVDSYRCEWAAVVNDPVRRARFQHFANSAETDSSVIWVEERAQRRPADWPKQARLGVGAAAKLRLPTVQKRWVPLVDADAVPADGGIAVKYGRVQLAVFNFASRGQWYATQNMCPHKQDMVLARGIIGDHKGQPKVACPQHKKTFALDTGESLSGEPYKIASFPVQVNGGIVYVELPAAETLESQLCRRGPSCQPNELTE